MAGWVVAARGSACRVSLTSNSRTGRPRRASSHRAQQADRPTSGNQYPPFVNHARKTAVYLFPRRQRSRLQFATTVLTLKVAKKGQHCYPTFGTGCRKNGCEYLWEKEVHGQKHDQFHILTPEERVETPLGYPSASSATRTVACLMRPTSVGTRTRLLRFAPGVSTPAPLCTRILEEVYLVSGDLTEAFTLTEMGASHFTPTRTHADRLGLHHGPFSLMAVLQFHYFDPV